MAKFINTRKGVSEIEDLIKNAKDKLILISPYLKLSKDFKELLTYRNGKGKKTIIIFKKKELSADEMKTLKGLHLIVLKHNENLHAKCYVNDDKMVITSMNLYEFSMANNKEMGVVIDKNDPSDISLFNDAMREVDYINEISQELESINPKVLDKKASYASEKKANFNTGYCIRTGIKIPFNINKPFCHDAYLIWSEYSNADLAEAFCHFSGDPSHGETSFNKPILKKNWKKAQDIYGLYLLSRAAPPS